MSTNFNQSKNRSILCIRKVSKLSLVTLLFFATLSAFSQGPPPPEPFVGCLPDVMFDSWVYEGDEQKYDGIIDSNSRAIRFSNDGTKVYILGLTNNVIEQHSLAFPFDISTASADVEEGFNVTDEETSPTSFTLSDDGIKLFVIGTDSQRIHSYTLSTPNKISTAVYDGEPASFFVGDRDNFPQGIAFNTMEANLFVLGGEHQKVMLFDLSSTFDISNPTFDSELILPSGVNLTSIDYDRTGSDLYLLDKGSNSILRYFGNLSNFSGSTSRGQLDLSATTSFAEGFDFSFPRVVVLDSNQDAVLEFGPDLSANYVESDQNDGTITTNTDPAIFRLINAVGDEFIDTDNDGILDGGVTIANLPDGLTAVFSLNDLKNEATLQLIGTAVNHDEDDDVVDLGIEFTPASNNTFFPSGYLCRLNISVDFQSNATGSVQDLLLNRVHLFSDGNKTLHLRTSEVVPQKMMLHNLIGKEVFQTTRFNAVNSDYSFPLNIETGMYIITLETNAGKVSKKIIFH